MSAKPKARVTLRLKEAVTSNTSVNKNVDLEAAATKFKVLQKQLRLLSGALRNQYQAMVQLQKSRAETVKIVTTLASNTPMQPASGRLSDGTALSSASNAVRPPQSPPGNGSPSSPSSSDGITENQHLSSGGTGGPVHETAFGSIMVPESKIPTKIENSYAAVHLALYRRGVLYADKFNQFVTNYVVEWEAIVTKRIMLGLKQAESLRRDLDHYSKKVEQMRVAANKTMQSGKMVDPKNAEKLKRNEQKLMTAREIHETYSHKLYLLIDEITARAWKDLHPLLIKLIQFDMNFSSDEAKIFAELTEAADMLKILGTEHKLDSKGRLQALQTTGAEDLYTGDANSNYTYSTAQITNGEPDYQQQQVGIGMGLPPGMGDDMSGYSDPQGYGSGGDSGGINYGDGMTPMSQQQGDSETNPFSPTHPSNMQMMPHGGGGGSNPDDGLFSPQRQQQQHPPQSQNGGMMHNQSFSGSFHSGTNGSSTMDMLHTADRSAPPPTMDMVNELNASAASLSLHSYGDQSGSGSGMGLMNSNGSGMGRQDSFNSSSYEASHRGSFQGGMMGGGNPNGINSAPSSGGQFGGGGMGNYQRQNSSGGGPPQAPPPGAPPPPPPPGQSPSMGGGGQPQMAMYSSSSNAMVQSSMPSHQYGNPTNSFGVPQGQQMPPQPPPPVPPQQQQHHQQFGGNNNNGGGGQMTMYNQQHQQGQMTTTQQRTQQFQHSNSMPQQRNPFDNF